MFGTAAYPTVGPCAPATLDSLAYLPVVGRLRVHLALPGTDILLCGWTRPKEAGPGRFHRNTYTWAERTTEAEGRCHRCAWLLPYLRPESLPR
jgi:hypothetical protein